MLLNLPSTINMENVQEKMLSNIPLYLPTSVLLCLIMYKSTLIITSLILFPTKQLLSTCTVVMVIQYCIHLLKPPAEVNLDEWKTR